MQLSEDLHDAQWITSAEFDDLINNKRMLADLQQADVCIKRWHLPDYPAGAPLYVWEYAKRIQDSL